MNEKDIILQPLRELVKCSGCERGVTKEGQYCCAECQWIVQGYMKPDSTKPHSYMCNLQQTDVGKHHSKVLLNRDTFREYEHKLRIVEELSR